MLRKEAIESSTLELLKSLTYFDDIVTDDFPKMILEKELSLTQVKNNISASVNNFTENLL